MSDGHGPTNADIMRRLDSFAEREERQEKRLAALEADRDLVHNLHSRVSEMGEKVTVIRDLLSKQEEHVIASVRLAVRAIAADVLAGVRAEMGGLRGEVTGLTKALRERPCFGGNGCEVEGDRHA